MDGTHDKIDLVFQDQLFEHLGPMGGVEFGVVIEDFYFSPGNPPLGIQFSHGGLTDLVHPVAVFGGPYRHFLNHADLDRFFRSIGKGRKDPGTQPQPRGSGSPSLEEIAAGKPIRNLAFNFF